LSLDALFVGLPAVSLVCAAVAARWSRSRTSPESFALIGAVLRDPFGREKRGITAARYPRQCRSVEALTRMLRLQNGDRSGAAERSESVSEFLGEAAGLCSSGNHPICHGCPRHRPDDITPGQASVNARNAAIRRLIEQSLPAHCGTGRLLKHSIATGVIAEHFAQFYGVDPHVATTAGLLHDLGRIGMWVGFGRRYARLAGRTFNHVDDIRAAEIAEFEIDHCQAGERISSAWGLPDSLRVPISTHHDMPGQHGLAGLVQLSCRLADAFLFESIAHRDTLGPVATARAAAGQEAARDVARRTTEIETAIILRLQCPGY
jgi:putative nucleotidyltransferase with HDIG domain